MSGKRRQAEDKSCCEEDSDYCMGVGLQTFLLLLISTCTFCVYRVCIPLAFSYGSAGGLLHAIGFGTCLALMIVSYLKAWLSDPGTVADSSWMEKCMSPDEVSIAQRAAKEPTAGWGGYDIHQVKYCKKCDLYRPPRSMHCRQCKKCVLRMDHHCPWIQNCVGAGNTKFFILFLTYGTLTCLYYSALCAYTVMHAFEGKGQLRHSEAAAWAALLVGSAIIVFMLLFMLGGLAGWNIYLLFKNQTALENYDLDVSFNPPRRYGAPAPKPRKPRVHRFDRGMYKNLQSVLGANPALWLLPVGDPSSGRLHPPATDC